jgi:hypothetical protein
MNYGTMSPSAELRNSVTINYGTLSHVSPSAELRNSVTMNDGTLSPSDEL